MYTLHLKFEINFSCGHTEKYTARSKSSAQSSAKELIEKQSNLCGKCYYRLCEQEGTIPWFSR